MTEEFEYLEDRIDNQQKWHSKKSIQNKQRFYFFEIIMLVAGALIPVINVLDIVPESWVRWLSASLAAIIVVSAGIGRLYKFQENWLNYRDLSEALKREKEFYLYEVGEYDIRNERTRNKTLVERVESILASSTSQYFSLHRATREEAQEPWSAATSHEGAGE